MHGLYAGRRHQHRKRLKLLKNRKRRPSKARQRRQTLARRFRFPGCVAAAIADAVFVAGIAHAGEKHDLAAPAARTNGRAMIPGAVLRSATPPLLPET